MKSVDSVIAQPHLPGTQSRETLDVLPIGYQSRTHCSPVICRGVRGVCVPSKRLRSYHREVLEQCARGFPCLARRWQNAWYEHHCSLQCLNLAIMDVKGFAYRVCEVTKWKGAENIACLRCEGSSKMMRSCRKQSAPSRLEDALVT